MKTLFFSSLLLVLSFFASAQSKGSAKLYGFSQSVSKGKAPELDENTGLRTSAGVGRNYFLYAASTSRIYPTEIWVEGTRYGVTINTVQQTPVEYRDETNLGAPAKVLIPKTSKKVIQLVLSKVMGTKTAGTKARTLSKTSDVVLVYKQGGKFYYSTLTSLTDLESVAAQ